MPVTEANPEYIEMRFKFSDEIRDAVKHIVELDLVNHKTKQILAFVTITRTPTPTKFSVQPTTNKSPLTEVKVVELTAKIMCDHKFTQGKDIWMHYRTDVEHLIAHATIDAEL